MNKYIMTMLPMFIAMAACNHSYQPAKYQTRADPVYADDGNTAIKIQCKQAFSDCLQEIGNICTNFGYEIIYNELLNKGSETTSSSDSNAYKIGNAVIATSSSSQNTVNIEDKYGIFRCKNTDTVEALRVRQEYLIQFEAKLKREYDLAHCGKIGYQSCAVEQRPIENRGNAMSWGSRRPSANMNGN